MEFTSMTEDTFRRDDDANNSNDDDEVDAKTRARKNWNIARKRVYRKNTNVEKWRSLTKTISHGLGEFLAGPEDIGPQPHELIMSDNKDVEDEESVWKSRTERLHRKSFLLRGRSKPRMKVRKDQFEPKEPFLKPYEKGEEPGIRESWVCRTPSASQASRKFTFQQSRQPSRISTTSSCRRATRPYPIPRTEKDSVLKIAYEGIKRLTSRAPIEDTASFRRRSFAPASRTAVHHMSISDDDVLDEDFFKQIQDESTKEEEEEEEEVEKKEEIKEKKETEDEKVEPTKYRNAVFFDCDTPITPIKELKKESKKVYFKKDEGEDRVGLDDDIIRHATKKYKNKIKVERGKRFEGDLLNKFDVNTSRNMYGEILGLDYRKSRVEDVHMMMKQGECRPYFTYWATTVQFLVYVFVCVVYGFSYVGFSESLVEDEVLMTSLTIEKVHYYEQSNMWIGPRQADLIHLGAKHSPCMRTDNNVFARMEERRKEESRSGCCIYNDMSGCVQTSKKECPETLATWYNETVCGQDPKYCMKSNIPTSLWSRTDFTLWPLCEENGRSEEIHMTCALVGRPCCVGIHGDCIIATPDYCEFRRGYFHPEATLCSQVKTCLSDVCGMLPFFYPEHPNHFYRLWTSLFLHAGILQFLLTLVFQIFVMRDVEKLLGWWRVGLVYILSGIGGSLTSSIFVPYHVEAGPSGSQFGILSCLFVEVIYSWSDLLSPGIAMCKLCGLLLMLLFVGLLPWVDNYAHISGFIVGFLTSFVLMPYVNFTGFGRTGRIVSASVCLCLLILVFVCLFLLFYHFPIKQCSFCHFLNCIPLTPSFCSSMEVSVPQS